MLTIPKIYEILKLLPYTVYLRASHKDIDIHTISTDGKTNSYLGTISITGDKSKQIILFTPWFVSPNISHASYEEDLYHNYLALELIENIEKIFNIVRIPKSQGAYVIRDIKDNKI